MCFDICTINIRVSIRVRGLHLVYVLPCYDKVLEWLHWYAALHTIAPALWGEILQVAGHLDPAFPTKTQPHLSGSNSARGARARDPLGTGKDLQKPFREHQMHPFSLPHPPRRLYHEHTATASGATSKSVTSAVAHMLVLFQVIYYEVMLYDILSFRVILFELLLYCIAGSYCLKSCFIALLKYVFSLHHCE